MLPESCWHTTIPGHCQVALDAARGLAYLHSRRIAHLDIKSANVLLTREGKAKISDVGLARVVQASHISSLDAQGTFAYAAPELISGAKCSESADLYSFGVRSCPGLPGASRPHPTPCCVRQKAVLLRASDCHKCSELADLYSFGVHQP